MNNTIILHCEAQKLRNGSINPKNYPWFPELILNLNEFQFIQVGVSSDTQFVNDFRTDLNLKEIKQLIIESRSWIGVDSFFQHLAWSVKKSGMCIFGYSDPLIFGHKENLNIVDRTKLRPNQFATWEEISFSEEVFENPIVIADKFREFIKSSN